MNLPDFRWRTLNTRITLVTLCIFLASIWSLAIYASKILREDMQRLLGEQQFSTATILAAGVNDDLGQRLRALDTFAGASAAAAVQGASDPQTLLERNPVLLELFNGGVAVLDADGTAIADIPRTAGRIGVNFMDREHVAAALKNGSAMIGRPIIGKKLLAPVFGMAVPVRDTQGRVVGAVLGVTDLSKPNFIDKIAGNVYGRTGGYLLVAPQYRLVFAASDKRRIMETLPAPGVNAAIDRFVDGYEGSAVFRASDGAEVLGSVKSVPLAGWFAGVALPIKEAFAPIRAVQQRVLAAAILLTLFAGGLTWAMLRRQLAPMLNTVKTLAAFSDARQFPAPLTVVRHDEVGELIGGFNRLLETLSQRDRALRENERKLATILESVDADIYMKDRDGRYLFANRKVRERFGLAEEEIVGYGDEKFFDAATAARMRTGDEQVLKEGQLLRTEETIRNRKDGSAATCLTVKLPLRDENGEIYALCGISTDITERKNMEDQIRRLGFYDSLTNLPNRRLFLDRTQQALAASKRTGRPGALLFIDLDNFKPLNDTHGHDIGDQLLVEVARRLQKCVREVDTVARFGGDEFVVMLCELPSDSAEARRQAGLVAQKILARLSEPYVLGIEPAAPGVRKIEHRCSASIGVALFTGGDANEDAVIKRADTAMYQAKEAGRGGIRFVDPDAGPSLQEAEAVG
ncbi:Cyclic di-GMP phosphodiesterase Gmr [Azoarcus sp. Aa7]|nr:Cyclic di-GMP phosphodiesterase Gmr [Azoarcus sp. Aa7]